MTQWLLENRSADNLAVQLEPWADVYYVRHGQTLKLEQPADLPGYYHTVFYAADSVSVFVEGFGQYPLVSIDGQAVYPFTDFRVPNA